MVFYSLPTVIPFDPLLAGRAMRIQLRQILRHGHRALMDMLSFPP